MRRASGDATRCSPCRQPNGLRIGRHASRAWCKANAWRVMVPSTFASRKEKGERRKEKKKASRTERVGHALYWCGTDGMHIIRRAASPCAHPSALRPRQHTSTDSMRREQRRRKQHVTYSHDFGLEKWKKKKNDKVRKRSRREVEVEHSFSTSTRIMKLALATVLVVAAVHVGAVTREECQVRYSKPDVSTRPCPACMRTFVHACFPNAAPKQNNTLQSLTRQRSRSKKKGDIIQ